MKPVCAPLGSASRDADHRQARRAGDVSPDALSYYEREGLLNSAARYRRYGDETVRSVRFIQHAQACGFMLVEIRELLQLGPRPAAPAARQRAMAMQTLKVLWIACLA